MLSLHPSVPPQSMKHVSLALSQPPVHALWHLLLLGAGVTPHAHIPPLSHSSPITLQSSKASGRALHIPLVLQASQSLLQGPSQHTPS